MNIAAYCRVSTDKEDQLNSLEAQKNFFTEYTKRSGDTLVKLYADEGISGTKIKNRKQFLQMMADANTGIFDMIVVKDISRFARNTVDLLENIRKLKALGIETQFLTANMTSMGNSEFVLTIFGALAQEESANTSKRVKFGKKINAEKGKVPNIVYGYDKTIGDYFNLKINADEAKNIRQMFEWYLKNGYGASKIANMMNEKGCFTKRGCKWTQNAVCRILSNEIYTGKIINGKEEVADFLTGRRVEKSKDEWFVSMRPELSIIDEETFFKTQKIMKQRGKKFKVNKERHSNKYLFSTLIKCKNCGWSFRRTVRTYKNTYVRWVCSGHNGKGAENCSNSISIDENELIEVIQKYFKDILSNKEKTIQSVVNGFKNIYKSKDENEACKKELEHELLKLKRKQNKYKDMYVDGIISREELKENIDKDKNEIQRLDDELKVIQNHITDSNMLEKILTKTFMEIEDILDLRNATNAQLSRIIDRIEVDCEGNVEIFIKHIHDFDLTQTVPICNC